MERTSEGRGGLVVSLSCREALCRDDGNQRASKSAAVVMARSWGSRRAGRIACGSMQRLH